MRSDSFENAERRFKWDWRTTILAIFVLGTLLVALLTSPLPQDLTYHDFSDRRTMFGIPNFLDVVSNLPFLLFGVLGIRASLALGARVTRSAWLVLFVGIAFVSVGSSYYHWMPNNATLVWDRLPMTVGFMGLFVALLGEYLDARLVKLLLIPAVLVGAGSVAYWSMTDDLRLYAWVQFMPLGLVALFLMLYASPFARRGLLVLALVFYLLAKVFEHFDAAIFDALARTASGHSIKHLLAASGCLSMVILVRSLRYGGQVSIARD